MVVACAAKRTTSLCWLIRPTARKAYARPSLTHRHRGGEPGFLRWWAGVLSQKLDFPIKNLTSWHHVNGDGLGGVGLVFVVVVQEVAVEYALVGSRVVVSHVEDEDGSVLQVCGSLAAVPFQAVAETFVYDYTLLIFIVVYLGKNSGIL